MKETITEGKKGSLLWILIVVLAILIIGIGVAIKFRPSDTTPQPPPSVSRAKVPPLPSPGQNPTPPSAQTPATPPTAEQKSAEAGSPTPGPIASPHAGDNITTTDLKPAAAEKGQAEKSASGPTPAGQASKAPASEAAPKASPAPQPPKAEAAASPQPAPSASTTGATPSPKTKSPAPTPEAAVGQRKEGAAARADLDKMAPFTIQVGAYRNKANADEVLSQLSKKGYAPFVFQVTDGQQRSFFMVRFGHFATREEAAKALDDFKLKENQNAVIVRSGMM